MRADEEAAERVVKVEVKAEAKVEVKVKVKVEEFVQGRMAQNGRTELGDIAGVFFFPSL
jgi:hypothetical protein